MTTDADRRRRAAERSGRIVVSRGDEPGGHDDLTPDQRVSLATELSRWAWEISGRPMPDYTRETMPVVVVRRGGE